MDFGQKLCFNIIAVVIIIILALMLFIFLKAGSFEKQQGCGENLPRSRGDPQSTK